MTPTPDYLLCDFETRSLAKLKAVGGRVYAAHATTEVLCVAFGAANADGGWDTASVWRPRAYPFDGRLDVVVAHNAIGFDRHIWARLGWPEPRRWLDSAILARRAGFAESSLAAVGAGFGFAKDIAGNRLTVGLSRESRKQRGTFAVDPIPAATAERVLEYCESDIHVMARIVEELSAEFDFALYPADTWQAAEDAVYNVDLAVLDRGIYFDQDFARALIRQEDTAEAAACESAGVEPEQMRSVAQFKALLAARGIDTPNAQRGTLEAYADDPIVAARLACTSIVRGKLEAGLARVGAGSRLRDMTKYYGAHTARWSGQGVQTQNLPRGGLVRGVLCAPPGKRLVVCDFAGIEARVLAWLAGDADAVALFEAGGDPYKRIASVIFGCDVAAVTKDQRAVGKVAELALGYGMGARKFEENAGREKLQALGIDARQVVQQWRQLRSPVVDLWAELERQWVVSDGYFHDMSDGTKRLTLPSGRELVYRDATHEGYIGRGGWLVRVYGGLLAENLVQATARELLAAAMVDVAACWPIVMHVHDEIVCEAPAALADAALEYVSGVMSSEGAPAWADGCPISSEGYVAERYRK